LFSPFVKGGLRGFLKSPPAPLFPPLVFPLYKRWIKRDFRNLPQPLFYKEGSDKEFYKGGFLFPFIKGRCKRDLSKTEN